MYTNGHHVITNLELCYLIDGGGFSVNLTEKEAAVLLGLHVNGILH